jgi:predicted Zn-dependent protease
MTTLGEELARNFRILQAKADPAPYYLAYAVTDTESGAVSATLGALQAKTNGHSRVLDITVRVGSPKRDNYHQVAGQRSHFTPGAYISLDDIPAAIKQRVWLETDRTYRLAAERFMKIQTDTQVKVAEEDTSNDFSPAEPSVYTEAPPPLKFPVEECAERVRKWSFLFSKQPEILASTVQLAVQREVKYLVTTEGSRLEHGRSFARIAIVAEGKASDGMDLMTSETFEAADFAGLPKDKAVAGAVERVSKDLVGLLHAPVVEPFAGPAILSGRAAGVFFHEIFGHRVEGHRQKDESEGQTFTKSLGQPVLPLFLSVIFDPTRRNLDGVDLNGWYAYDDEGVKARPVTVVDHGILKTFLMSRSPVKGIGESNGHGRRQAGLEVVSRQSNLIVESDRKVSEKRLREMLIEEIKRQNKPYGLYFQDITGGYTTTGRGGAQTFKVIPLVVYRVYPDGRPDELVRGADIVGTPLSSFAKILATSDKLGIFNGYCGAESGSVPVSASAPSLLVSEIEIEKTQKSQDRPPLLPAPAATGGAE